MYIMLKSVGLTRISYNNFDPLLSYKKSIFKFA